MKLPPDVPAAVVFVHLAALAALLLHVAVVLLRRTAVMRQSRTLSGPLWLHLLYALLERLRSLLD